MKSRYIIGVAFISIICCCERLNNQPQLSVDQIIYGDCKQGTTKSENTEYIEYRTAQKQYLQINHMNVWFNCEPGKILVDAEIGNDTIVINENEQSSEANCICPYDLSYRTGPMAYAQYVIVIRRGGGVYTMFPVDFNSSTDGVYDIEY